VGTQMREVLANSSPRDVGDEPLLLAQRLKCPVFVGQDRAVAARALIAAHPDTQLIVSDDGLQHHALARSAEVIVFDERGIGNGWCIPAGPLREPWPREPHAAVPEISLSRGILPPRAHILTRALAGYAMQADGTRRELAEFADQPIHAIAAIAQPQAFFEMLRASGLRIASTEALPDHYHFDSYKPNKFSDVDVETSEILLFCTEKDAVKLWRTHREAWAVPLAVEIPEEALQAIDAALGLGTTPDQAA
jgi:tetraacyldisaccharide 4'-kinase